MKTHGRRSTYKNGCRCDACRGAHAAYQLAARLRRRTAGLPDDDPRHGKVSTYNNYGCRCDACRASLRRPIVLPAGDPRHGVNGYSNYGCRCHVCTVAWRRKSQRIERRLRRAVRLRGAA